MSVAWKIFYGDGATWSDLDGSWESAPHRNVQYVAHRDERDPKDVLHVGSLTNTGDFYVWWPDQLWPWGCDVMGMLDYLIEVGAASEDTRLSDLSVEDLRAAGVKLGRSLGDARFRKIQEQVRADPDLPRKSALRPPGSPAR
jgi:hypothetical protein